MTARFKAVSIFALTLFLLVLAAGCGGEEKAGISDTAPLTDTGGKLQLAETTYDFGNIPVGQQVEHKFTIRNNGTGPLQLGELSVKRLEGC